MHRCAAVVLVSVMLGPVPSFAQGQRENTSPPEILHIDGSKSPELIPQWSAWGFGFRVVAGGPRQLPSIVYRLASKEEADMILLEADTLQSIDRDCKERASKLRTLVGSEKVEVLDARLREITVDCRRKTLDARDRVLRKLNPQAASALIEFVESTKSGTSVSMPKRDLARYLEPE
jgi:hypothetical protein